MKAIKTTFIGAALGLVASVGLILLGFTCDFLSCACSILTCNFNPSASMTDAVADNFGSVCIFCMACGAAIGFVYGIYKMKEEDDEEFVRRMAAKSEEAQKQRKMWASEVKQKALNVNNTCSRNQASDKPLVSTTYKANAQMTEIMNELTKVAEKQGKVDSLAEELSKKGGASI